MQISYFMIVFRSKSSITITIVFSKIEGPDIIKVLYLSFDNYRYPFTRLRKDFVSVPEQLRPVCQTIRASSLIACSLFTLPISRENLVIHYSFINSKRSQKLINTFSFTPLDPGFLRSGLASEAGQHSTDIGDRHSVLSNAIQSQPLNQLL